MIKKSLSRYEICIPNRILAAFLLLSYLSVLTPAPVFANSRSQEVSEWKEVLISARTGGKIELNGASIEIPEGALKKDTKISITHLRRVEDTGESLYNAIPSSGGYRFLPHGTKFLKDVTITLPYSPELNGKPQALEDLYTYFYDEKNYRWIKLERLEVNQKECVVRSLSSHFTDMINATLTLPESASPVDVNLNSIKNLEAAKPDGHLIKFNAPKASNMGDAGFSFELAVPAGRRGMEPAISVSYSSGGGNGIMGKGFDVTYGSSVTIDTRLGLPEYDSKEYTGSTEEIRLGLQKIKIKPVKYMLDGILLYEKIEARTESYASYMQQKEGSFSRIEHFFGDKNYWLVTDKSGTKRYYGQTSASCVGAGNETYTWNLTKVVDVHGNTIIYKYKDKDDSGYSYPEQIQYTGYEGKNAEAEEGSYYVNFIYDEKPNDAVVGESWPRSDIRLDARSKSVVACKKLLTSITTRYKENKPIRTYTFKYKEGLAKEKMLTAISVMNNADESYEYSFEYNPVEKTEDGKIEIFSKVAKWDNGEPVRTGYSDSSGTNYFIGGGGGYGYSGFADARGTCSKVSSSSSGDSHTEDLLIDINGDGRPDSVRKKGKSIEAALNTGNGFADFTPLVIKNGSFSSDLEKEHYKNEGNGYTWYVGGGIKSPNVTPACGKSTTNIWQSTTTTTECSFLDVDGDGLVDIVERDKETYLKNYGNLIFEEAKFYSNDNFKEVIRPLSEDQIKLYNQSYFVQTPFRMWKAPYEGEIVISQEAQKLYDNEQKIDLQTYIESGESEKVISKTIESKNSQTFANDYATLKKDDVLYFISDSGEEPLNTDISWKISLEYNSAKILKTAYPKPYISDEGEIYPKVFSPEEFTSYAEAIKKLCNDNAMDENAKYKVVRDFAAHFIHRTRENLYILDESKFNEHHTAGDFFNTYPIEEDTAKKALENYKILDFKLIAANNECYYGKTSEMITDNAVQDLFFQNDENLGYRVFSTYNKNPLVYDSFNKKLLILKNGFLSDVDFSYEIKTPDNPDENCLVFNIGKDKNGVFESSVCVNFDSSSLVQVFYEDHLFDIKNGKISYIALTDDAGFETKNKEIDFIWVSGEKTEEAGNDLVLYESEEECDIRVKNDEILYGGGKSGWYYGVWQGNLKEVPFSQKALKESLNDDISKEDFESNISNIQSQTDSENSIDTNQINQIKFYLPKKGSELSSDEGISDLKNSSIDYSVNMQDVLCGKISCNYDSAQTRYYMPFIAGNIIHPDRYGGNTYYNIEGLYSKKKTGSKRFPYVRKTYTDGKDETESYKGDIAIAGTVSLCGVAYDLNDDINISLEKNCTNTSKSYVLQDFIDIDGNGIPDYIYKSESGDSKYEALLGSLNIESGELEYSKAEKLNSIDQINRVTTKADISGGGFSFSGNLQVHFDGNQVRPVIGGSSPFPGFSHTNASGSTTFQNSIFDVNGDGLNDYFDGEYIKINTGLDFSDEKEKFQKIKSIKDIKNESFGRNFSISTGGGTPNSENFYTGISLSVGGTYSVSSSNTEKLLMDINGDGLVDIVSMKTGEAEAEVCFNNGSGYEKAEKIILPKWENGVSNELFWGMDDIDSFKLNGIEFLSTGKILDKIGDTKILDFKLDDIPDFYKNKNNFSNHLNSLEWTSDVTLSMAENASETLNIGINIIILGIYIGTVNMTEAGGLGRNFSSSLNCATVKMMDLDGDGLPDHVLRIPGDETYWKRNISGKYGLLNKINLPQGGNIELEYTEMYGTVKNPNFKYVMSKVTVNDGCGETVPKIDHGKHSLVTEYKYEDGYYDRAKKDFYGFGKVTTTFADGSKQLDEYNNSDYYLKGTLSSSTFFDENGNALSENSTKYCDAPFGLPATENSKQYEAASEDAFIETSSSYEYDEYGNCTSIEQDFGNGEKLYAKIEYENRDSSDKYLIGLPVDISVYGTDDTLLRHRSGTYNDEGQLTSLKQYFSSSGYSENTLTYDAYGNITSVKDSRDATLAYEYDKDVHMFVRTIRQKGSGTDEYVSSIETVASTQTKESESDCNGNKIEYRYDKWQRLTKVWDSYSTETTPAVTYEYYCPYKNADGTHELWYTITNNKVTFDKNDDSVIRTVMQIDGLGRASRTAKTGFVNGKLGWNASGAVKYDEKGRPVVEGMTEFIEGSLETLLNTTPRMTELKTYHQYDARDRKIKTKLPDGAIQTTSFRIENKRLITETTDPLGNIAVQETDSRGNIVRVARKNSAGEQLTEVTYKYNEVGEMLKAFDAKGHPISAEYDMLGRRIALESLDSGRQEFYYDTASNLIRERNSALSARGKQINYEYDGLNRLVKIDYPDTKDTVYTYGGTADKNVGASGKILKVEDASGTLEYEYGKLGEVTKEKRTLATHLNGENPTVTAEMKYRSDYLGRMQSITYPDGEELIYGYDDGGQVVSVTGNHWGTEFKYVTNILYDQYGQRTRIEYGNGTHTEYTYDPARRWLRTIKTQNKGGIQFQNMSYEFDLVGNVKGYENDCLDGGRGNYKTCQEYKYDDLYQLIRVDGNTTYDPYKSLVPEFVSKYSQEFEFDNDGLGNMVKKTSSESVTPKKTIGDNLNYTFDYVYDPNYSHRLINAGNMYYQYDANGNVTCEQDGSFESNGDDTTYRKITEEAENVYSSAYGWGLWREEVGGKSNGRYRRTYSWNERNQLVCSQDSRYTTNYIYGQDGQRTNKYTARSETLYFNKMWTLHTDSGNSVYGGQNTKNIYLGDTRIVTKLASPRENTIHEEYYKQYYYHSDHLGSASLISDYKGDEYQRIEYTPYGETWVEKTQNTGLEYLPYKFTGQEKDEETGNYYIGARYLQPQTCRWLSCDPAVGDYLSKTSEGEGGIYNSVNLNLYHYAGNSPIQYKDADGRIIVNSADTMMSEGTGNLGNSNAKISDVGCTLTGYVRMANALGANVSLDDANSFANKNNLFTDGDLLTVENGANLVNGLLKEAGITDVSISYENSSYGENDSYKSYSEHSNSESEYFCNARIDTSNKDGTSSYGHTTSVDSNALNSDRCDGKPTNLRIRDTSPTGRNQIHGDSSGRTNTLERLDFFKINRTVQE